MKKNILFLMLILCVTVQGFSGGSKEKVSAQQTQVSESHSDADSQASKAVEAAIEITSAADAISQASKAHYYADSSWNMAKTLEVLKSGVSSQAAVVVSTTNADGTPNAATIVPAIIDDTHLFFSFGSNGSTKQNLLERSYGVITLYVHQPKADNKLDRNQGVRIVVKAVTDPAKITELLHKSGKAADTSVFVEIIRVIPLG